MNRSYLYLCSATDIDCDVTACSDVVGFIELGVHIALDAHLSYQNFVIFLLKYVLNFWLLEAVRMLFLTVVIFSYITFSHVIG